MSRTGALLLTLVAALPVAVAYRLPPRPRAPTPKAISHDTALTIDASGGSLEVTEGVLRGTKVVVPGGALERPETIRIRRSALPGDLARDAALLSEVVELTKDSPAA